MATTIRDIATRFNSRALNAEQSERVQAIRHAAGGFAAVIFQAIADSGERERALAAVDEAFAFARLGVEREQSQGGKDGTAERLELLDKVSAGLSKTDAAALRGFVGIVDIEPLGDKKKKPKDS